MKIGLVGLGAMGRGIAHNLLKSGAELTVCAASRRAFPEFEEMGVRATLDLREIAEADRVFLCLPNGEIVENVVCGEKGLLNSMGSGQIIVDLSTIAYATTMQIAKACTEKDVGFLDAPISGMQSRALDGSLTVMCGGSKDIFDQVKPLLDRIGTKVILMGGIGCGQLAKLVNQLLFDINAAALAEILPMSAKMGLDSCKMGEIINSSTGRSYASEFFIPRDLEGVYSEGYAMENAYKDLISAAELGARQRIPMPLTNAAIMTFQVSLLKGFGNESKGAMIKVYEDLLGVKFSKTRG